MSVGTQIAGYRLEEEIGRGGMGVVYRAHDVALERSVALKLLAPQLAEDPDFRERFLVESRLAASLDHPNVVPVYDAGEVEGQLYLAMRYVEGSDLKRLLADEGKLEPARAIAICSQIANALDAAHARGLVHRDVKPSNVLLDERRARLSRRLRADAAAHRRRAGLRRRSLARHAGLRRPRADRGQGRGRESRPVLAGLPAPRVPDRRAALPARLGGRHALRPPGGATARRARPGRRDGEERSQSLRTTGTRRAPSSSPTRAARSAWSPSAPAGRWRSPASGRRCSARLCWRSF